MVLSLSSVTKMLAVKWQLSNFSKMILYICTTNHMKQKFSLQSMSLDASTNTNSQMVVLLIYNVQLVHNVNSKQETAYTMQVAAYIIHTFPLDSLTQVQGGLY